MSFSLRKHCKPFFMAAACVSTHSYLIEKNYRLKVAATYTEINVYYLFLEKFTEKVV